MKAYAKTYLMQFSGAMLLYVVILFVSVRLLDVLAGSPWRALAALLPVLPIALGMMAFMRFFRGMDELQKRIQLDALAFSFAATGLLTFSYGLLQNAGLPQVPLLVVFPLMIALWGLGTVLAARRYV